MKNNPTSLLMLLLAPFIALFLFSINAAADTPPGDDKPVVDISDKDTLTSTDYPISDVQVADDPVAAPLPPPKTDTAAAPQSNDLWQRIRSGFGMATLQSPFTATHEAWYAARPDYVQRMVGRSQLYLYHIVEEVQKRGMPTEIALLPMVESAFNPEAYSRSKASGIWQFIPSTGKNFGLKQDWWSDNRRDVTAATDAALNYLDKLHVMFGTWELALAAYNAGEGTVQRAIERNRRKGLPTDYQSLQLPPETREYVPKLQAVKNIVTNPEQYGLQIKSIANQPYFTSVSAPGKIDVKLAAKLAGVSMAEFTQLNPAHNRPVMANGSSKQNILVPVGKEDQFSNNLANYNQSLVSWQTYHAKRGEPLASVAKKYGVSVAELREANDLSAKTRLKPNQPILVPAKGGTDAQPVIDETSFKDTVTQSDQSALAPQKRTAQLHVVQKGDTAFKIAKRYGLTTKQLLTNNGLKNAKLHHGQILAINAPSDALEQKKVSKTSKAAKIPKSSPGKIRYMVKKGETLDSIAKKFSVAASDIQRWNKLSGSRVLPGHKLIIFKSDAA